MIEVIRNLFRRASADELMQRELDEARRSLLEALSTRDHAEASVAYHESRINRLERMLLGDYSVGGTE